MFCPQCGASNADTAAVCVQCGRNLQTIVAPTQLSTAGAAITSGAVAPGMVPNYLVFAILTTVLCCLPAGIPAIIYAAQVNTKLQVGDLAGAQAASNNAKMWCWIAVGLGLATVGFYIILAMVGVLGSLHQR
jgi:hypothetical protein